MAQSVIGALRVTLGLDSRQFSRGLQQAGSSAQRIGRQMQVIGAAVTAVGTGLAIAISGQLTAIDELGETAQKIGVPVEALSQLQHAAKLSGLSMDGLQTSLTRLGQNMAQNEYAFRNLGISVRDANGQMRPVLDVFMEVSDLMAAMPDGAEKTALAMQLMGRGGSEMIPLMNGGSEAIRQMMEEANALGLTISEETAKAAGDFSDNMDRIKAAGSGILLQVTANLAPFLADLSDRLVEVSGFFQTLSPQVQEFISIMAGLTVVIGPVLIALGLLAATIGAPAIGLVAVITAVLAAVIAFWDELIYAKGVIQQFITDGIDRVKTAMSDLADTMRDKAQQAVEWVKEKFEELVAYFQALPERFIEFGRNIITGLWTGLQEAWDSFQPAEWLKGKAAELVNVLPEWMRMRSPSRVMYDQGQNIVAGLELGLRDGMQGPIDALNELGAAMAQTIDENAIERGKDEMVDFFTSILTGAKSAKDALADLLLQMAEVQIQKGLLGLFDAVPALGNVAGLLGSALTIPSFAGGGYTGSGMMRGGLDGIGGSLAMVHPNELIIPEKMMAGMGGGTININLTGVSGDDAVRRAVQQGVTQGLAAYDRSLPSRVRQISGDPRAI